MRAVYHTVDLAQRVLGDLRQRYPFMKLSYARKEPESKHIEIGSPTKVLWSARFVFSFRRKEGWKEATERRVLMRSSRVGAVDVVPVLETGRADQALFGALPLL